MNFFLTKNKKFFNKIENMKLKKSSIKSLDFSQSLVKNVLYEALLKLGIPSFNNDDKNKKIKKLCKKIEYEIYLISFSLPTSKKNSNNFFKNCTICTNCTNAAKNGHLDCLEYLNKNGCHWDEDYIGAVAAKNGHLDILMYAHDYGCSLDEINFLDAAEDGHLDILKYAYEHGCPWDENTCSFAASAGHLDILMYAHKNKCPWDEFTCAWAAYNGHLDCLKYAHENGCPWTERTCTLAADGGHLNCLQYAVENGCPIDKEKCLKNVKTYIESLFSKDKKC
jgi:hypothetical protein